MSTNVAAGGYDSMAYGQNPWVAGIGYGQQLSGASANWVNSGTFSFQGNILKEESVAIKETQFVVYDLDNQRIESAHDDETAAKAAARSLAGRKDIRAVVFKPVMISEPKKETVDRDL